MNNLPQYKINGKERREMKKKLSGLKLFLKNFWYNHQLEKDMGAIYGDSSHIMSDDDAGEVYKNTELSVSRLEDKLGEKITYNHDRPLSDFKHDIDEIRKAGFNPIAVTRTDLENVFVFETFDEAEKAFDSLEVDKFSPVCGYWYDREEFMEWVADQESNGKTKVRIYWLNEENSK